MKKRITTALLSMLACLIFTVPMFAINASASELPRVVDGADLLSDKEEDKLLDKLDDISKDYECDVIVITLEDLDGYSSSQAAADDIFDYAGYGYGSKDSGILLLISIEDGDWAISTYGKGIDVFSDKRLNSIKNEIKPHLSDENFYEAFDSYADLCEKYLKNPVAIEWYFIPIAIGIGVVIALIVANTMKESLNSVKPQKSAANYMRQGSMRITNQREIFLYNHVTKTKIESSNSSGGSSTHTSSSGRSHGGMSGKF